MTKGITGWKSLGEKRYIFAKQIQTLDIVNAYEYNCVIIHKIKHSSSRGVDELQHENPICNPIIPFCK